MKRWLFIIFLFLITVISFLFAYETDNAPAYYLAIVSLVIFCLIYSVEVLDYRIGGQHLSLEKRLNVLAAEQKEVKELANTLLKIIYIQQDGASRYGGVPQEHKDLTDKYMETLSKYFEPNLMDNIKNDILDLDKLISERNNN